MIINRLKLVGDGNNSVDGLALKNTLDANNQLSFIQILDTEVTGYGGTGIILTGDASGFADVLISGAFSHDNLRCGIQMFNTGVNYKTLIHTNVRVERSTVTRIGYPAFPTRHRTRATALSRVRSRAASCNTTSSMIAPTTMAP